MGGEVPNLADLAVFGVLSAIEGCQAFKVQYKLFWVSLNSAILFYQQTRIVKNNLAK